MKMSISSSPTKRCDCSRAIRAWITMAILCLFCGWSDHLLAQGSSIPTTSEVKEQRIDEWMMENLPEGVKYRYPLLNGMSVSANIFSPILNIFGKDYGSYEGALTLDIHHRFFPQAAAGAGYCDVTNEDSLRYHSRLRPFFKAGLLYNFNYNDLKPNDFYGALIRFGYAYSSADISGLSYTDGFWPNYKPDDMKDLKFHSIWMEIGGFIKVQIADHISMGWDVTFKPFLRKGGDKQGEPYFVPGYGTTNSKLGFGFHVYYDLNRKIK